MQSHHSKEVVKDVTSATQLESELVLSQAQYGVAVLDVYNAEWGSCKALGETFRRLFTDAGDVVHLRFFSVECNSVMESLLAQEEPKGVARTRGMACAPDTRSARWGPILESRRGHSKPYFVFFKEGKMRGHIEGIDTPRICKMVQELCRAQPPATDSITSADALRFWEANFSLAESTVPEREFAAALARESAASGGRPLLRDDTNALLQAIGVDADGAVTAAAFQAWVGDSELVAVRVAACVATAAAAAPRRAAPVMKAEEEEEEEEEAREADSSARAVTAVAEGAEVILSEEGLSAAEEAFRELGEDAEGAYPAEATAEGEAVLAAQPAESLSGAEEQANERTVDADVSEAREGSAEEREPDEEEAEAEAASSPAAAMEAVETREVDPLSTAAGNVGELHTDEERAYPTEAVAEPEELSEHAEKEADAPTLPTEAGPSDVPMDSHESPEKMEELREAEEATEVDVAATAGVHQIFTDRWVTVTEEEMRVWNVVAALPLHYPTPTAPFLQPSTPAATERAARLLPPVAEEFPTLASYLEEQGVPAADVSMMCLAAEQKVGSESLSFGKLALILISSDEEGTTGLLPTPENLSGRLAAGTVIDTHQPLAFTALCLCASDAYPEEQFFFLPPAGEEPLDVADGAEFTLDALTPLHANAPAEEAGRHYRIIGLPRVIELATTDDCEDTMVLSQWFCKLRVAAVEGDTVTLQFVEVLCHDAFDEFSAVYTARLEEDEARLDKKAAPGSPAAADELSEGEEEEYEMEEEEEITEEEEEFEGPAEL